MQFFQCDRFVIFLHVLNEYEERKSTNRVVMFSLFLSFFFPLLLFGYYMSPKLEEKDIVEQKKRNHRKLQ